VPFSRLARWRSAKHGTGDKRQQQKWHPCVSGTGRSAPRGDGVTVGGLGQLDLALELAEAALAALLARRRLGVLVALGVARGGGRLAPALAGDGQLPVLLVHADLRGGVRD